MLYDTHAKDKPALLIPYDNQHVVRSFAFVSTKYLGYEAGKPVWALPAPIELEAAPNQYLVWQLAVVEIFRGGRWANIKSVQRYAKSGRLLKVWRQISLVDRVAWTRDAAGTGPLLLTAFRRLPIGYRGS